MPKKYEEIFCQSLACNSSAFLVIILFLSYFKFFNIKGEKGSSTEIALLEFLVRCNVDYKAIREKYKVIKKFPFSSARKRMSIILEYEIDGQIRRRIFTKGK